MWHYRARHSLRLEDQVLEGLRKRKSLKVDIKTKDTVEAFPPSSCYSLGHTRVGGGHETEQSG